MKYEYMTQAMVLIPIRLGAKATPGALRGGLATAKRPVVSYLRTR